MAIRRREEHHYTLEQVAGHVRDALEVAAQCGLTDDERVALLPTIVDKLAGKQVLLEELGGLPNMAIPKGLG